MIGYMNSISDTEPDFFVDDRGVGIGTADLDLKLTLDDDGGILAKGTLYSGATLAASGSGARLIWYPRKAAFRAGAVSGTEWDDANIGNYSVAMGYWPTASGIGATAIGVETIASGGFSTAMGAQTIASGLYSTAIGKGYYPTHLENNQADSFMIGYMNSTLDTTPELFVRDGGVGIGTTDPENTLHVTETSAGELTYPVKITNAGTTNGTATGLLFQIDTGADRGKGALVYERTTTWNRGRFMFLQNDVADDTQPDASDAVMIIANDGQVVIGTTPRPGRLSVYGPIYQYGALLHADYVFEPDYALESIEAHAAYMWQEKHLKAVPGVQYDEDGQEVLEAGAHRRGILEELEKAHVYIEQLNEQIKDLRALVCLDHPGAAICP